jgi:hypothetical protein
MGSSSTVHLSQASTLALRTRTAETAPTLTADPADAAAVPQFPEQAQVELSAACLNRMAE